MAFTPKEKEISQIIEAAHQPEQISDVANFESFERKKQPVQSLHQIILIN